jgi:hypothetical protein
MLPFGFTFLGLEENDILEVGKKATGNAAHKRKNPHVGKPFAPNANMRLASMVLFEHSAYLFNLV